MDALRVLFKRKLETILTKGSLINQNQVNSVSSSSFSPLVPWQRGETELIRIIVPLSQFLYVNFSCSSSQSSTNREPFICSFLFLNIMSLIIEEIYGILWSYKVDVLKNLESINWINWLDKKRFHIVGGYCFRCGKFVVRMEEGWTPVKVLMGPTSRRRVAGRPKSQWVDNISRDVQDLGFEGTWTERSTDKTRRRKLALGSGAQCGLWVTWLLFQIEWHIHPYMENRLGKKIL